MLPMTRGSAGRKASHQNKDVTSTESHGAYDFMCQGCNRSCQSRIQLYSHTRGCSSTNSTGATPSSARLKDANNIIYRIVVRTVGFLPPLTYPLLNIVQLVRTINIYRPCITSQCCSVIVLVFLLLRKPLQYSVG